MVYFGLEQRLSTIKSLIFIHQAMGIKTTFDLCLLLRDQNTLCRFMENATCLKLTRSLLKIWALCVTIFLFSPMGVFLKWPPDGHGMLSPASQKQNSPIPQCLLMD